MSSHVLAAPAVLYLHGGAVTSRLAAKPSKDTAAYARHLVTWAVRQTLLPEALVESAAEKMLVGSPPWDSQLAFKLSATSSPFLHLGTCSL